jgi:hypothetical protein
MIGKMSSKRICRGKLATDKRYRVIAMLTKPDFNCLLCVSNVDLVAALTSGLIDQELLTTFTTEWAFSVNLRCHRTIAGSVHAVSTIDSIHQFILLVLLVHLPQVRKAMVRHRDTEPFQIELVAKPLQNDMDRL